MYLDTSSVVRLGFLPRMTAQEIEEDINSLPPRLLSVDQKFIPHAVVDKLRRAETVEQTARLSSLISPDGTANG